MSLCLADIATAPVDRYTPVPLPELAAERGIPSSKLRLLQRYFRLESAAAFTGDQSDMLRAALETLVAAHPDLRAGPGLLLFVRTQTHATHAADDWLTSLAAEVGLAGWDVMAQTQTHCAGGLAAIEVITALATAHPVIVLTGEKCFHPVTANQSGAVLGEAPVAALFRSVCDGAVMPGWRVAHSTTRHQPEFHANPHQMSPELRKAWEKGFGGFMDRFLTESLNKFGLDPSQIDLVVPYNLNLPLLESLAQRRGWQDILFTGTLARVGHLFCADVYFNLAQVLPDTRAHRVLCFAAGMGATFSSIVLERSEIAIEHLPERQNGRPGAAAHSS